MNMQLKDEFLKGKELFEQLSPEQQKEEMDIAQKKLDFLKEDNNMLVLTRSLAAGNLCGMLDAGEICTKYAQKFNMDQISAIKELSDVIKMSLHSSSEKPKPQKVKKKISVPKQKKEEKKSFSTIGESAIFKDMRKKKK